MSAQKNYTKLQNIPILNQETCKIKDKVRVERVLNGLIAGGVRRLQVISDFDHTITKKVNDEGKTVLQSLMIVFACESISNEYMEKLRIFRESQRNKQDSTISEDEKMKNSIESFHKMLELLKGFTLTDEEIEKKCYESVTSFRDGTDTFFHTLYNDSVPLLLLSAGIGNSIVACLKKQNLLLQNVTIISNFIKFKDGVIEGYQNEIISLYDKSLSIDVRKYSESIPDRDNIIVIGDRICDAAMANSITSSKNVLKIGFLYDLQSIDEYMKVFDIVLIGDNTMNVPQAIINLISN